ARAELHAMTIERYREAATSKQAKADLGQVTSERDTALQVALTSGDVDLIRDATRLGGEALFYRTTYYRVVPPEQRVALPQLSGS
ncbi:hypothetical protein KI387_028168, partial [Taxus chinensis]